MKKTKEILKNLEKKFKVKIRVESEKRIWVEAEKDSVVEICRFLKSQGFEHLSAVAVTDYLKEKKFEITYHLWSYTEKVLITIKTKISRNKPVMESCVSVYEENAQIHEREAYEMFGVIFKGNPDLSPLFLEDWKGPPPFRKDFNWRKYVLEKFYKKGNERQKSYRVVE